MYLKPPEKDLLSDMRSFAVFFFFHDSFHVSQNKRFVHFIDFTLQDFSTSEFELLRLGGIKG